MNRAVLSPSAANNAENRKTMKYRSCTGIVAPIIAVETLAALGDGASAFFSGNAVCVLGTVPTSHGLDDVCL